MTAVTEDPPVRSAGILLHPTSLPGPYGIGDLGDAAYRWIDALVQARQQWWQILPLNPTGFGNSPYQSYSAFAGNAHLISPDLLVRDGLLTRDQIPHESFPRDHVDYDRDAAFKRKILRRAWENFSAGAAASLRGDFEAFRQEHHSWLNDYALFRALKQAHNEAAWFDWPRELIERRPEALAAAARELRPHVEYYTFCQFLFYRQWRALKAYANGHGVRIIGDIPIFVAGDSVDVWANQRLFKLDASGQPTVVAGVPPDYFSATGQLWGNPLYDWDAIRAAGYRWWLDRIRITLQQVDLIRLDHFRGFQAYWEVPAGHATAEHGHWVEAPGAELFQLLRQEFGGLPFIAEDLGLITPEVDQLRKQFNLPGMRVLQFAFGGDNKNPYLPHNYEHNTVVYTGTHDNNTTRGWYAQAPEHERDHARRYLARDGSDIAWDFIRTAWSSIANFAIAPLQDVLNLGAEARMNFPGRAHGNWKWRFREEAVTPDVLGRLADLTQLYRREPEQTAER